MEENQNEQINDEAQKTEETIAKKVYDDTVAAFNAKIEELTKANKTLTKQVDDYSNVLRNINVTKFEENNKSSDELVKILMGGIK